MQICHEDEVPPQSLFRDNLYQNYRDSVEWYRILHIKASSFNARIYYILNKIQPQTWPQKPDCQIRLNL